MRILISCMFVSFCTWLVNCLLAMCLCFVLCEHVASVFVFCVPCALMSIVLTPSILLPDYWLICPTCLPSLPSSFAPFIISLCLQSCTSSSSFHPGCILPSLVLPSLVLPCPALFLFSPQGVVFYLFIFY